MTGQAMATADAMMRDLDRPRGGIEERIELGIRRNRMGRGRIVLTDGRGAPLPGRRITLRQKSHRFLFGANLFKLRDFAAQADNERFEAAFQRVFNVATIPFYWDTLEPERGRFRYAANDPPLERRPPTDLAVGWCLANSIRPKGHWLFCDAHVPGWVPHAGPELMVLLEKRIARLADRYGETVPIWDCVNEAFSAPRWHLPVTGWSAPPQDYVLEVFRLAEKYFPAKTELVYNDGNAVSFLRYKRGNSPMTLLARELLGRGARLGGLGMQFHLFHTPAELAGGGHPYLDPVNLFAVLDEYAALGLPLHISEISLPTFPQLPRKEAEEIQARLLRHLYRIWFSQERMASIVWWNLVDKTAYQGEGVYDAGLLDEHLEPKPAFLALDRLVNREWHTETEVVTDERGIADWSGFHGAYDLSVDGDRPRAISLTDDGPNEEHLVLV